MPTLRLFHTRGPTVDFSPTPSNTLIFLSSSLPASLSRFSLSLSPFFSLRSLVPSIFGFPCVPVAGHAHVASRPVPPRFALLIRGSSHALAFSRFLSSLRVVCEGESPKVGLVARHVDGARARAVRGEGRGWKQREQLLPRFKVLPRRSGVVPSSSLPLSDSRGPYHPRGPTYRSASCEVRPSHYIPLGRLRGVYTVEASSVTARCKKGKKGYERTLAVPATQGGREGADATCLSFTVVRLPRLPRFFLFSMLARLKRQRETAEKGPRKGRKERRHGENRDGRGLEGKCVLDRGLERCRNPH